MNKEANTLRPSQLIYHFGPGSVVDMVDQSMVVMAADLWNTWNTPIEEDERITKALGVDYIKLLNEDPDSVKVRATPFPKWKICPKCGMMSNYSSNKCYYCAQNKEEIELYPSRFIIACKNGHISDFPYMEWVHQSGPCTSGKPALKFSRNGNSGSLSDLSVQCVKCKKRATLGHIMQKDALKKVLPECHGERPWIGDQVKCSEGVETYLRGASNVYSPAVSSFLQIPLSEQDRDPIIDNIFEHKKTLEKALTKGEQSFYFALDMLDIDEQHDVLVRQILSGEYHEEITLQSLRGQEWNTLLRGKVDDLFTGYKSDKVEIHEDMKPYFSAVHKIESLPELQVLQGFTRMEFLDRFELRGSQNLNSVMKDESQNWLPGNRNQGEGIFFQFNEHKINKWLKEKNPGALISEIIGHYNYQREQMKFSSLDVESKDLLIHTFSHALIKELARHSGYATTSLKERMYTMNGMHGVLIYTASGDSEGTLGGLIELSSPDKLYPIFIRALENMMHCSSDPHCSEGEFDFQSTANGAACHACSYVSETSCEWGNQLLDRRLLVDINPSESYGFFDRL